MEIIISVILLKGKWFPKLLGGQGAMVLITDGGPGGTLTPFISNGTAAAAEGGSSMTKFIPTDPPILEAHPRIRYLVVVF